MPPGYHFHFLKFICFINLKVPLPSVQLHYRFKWSIHLLWSSSTIPRINWSYSYSQVKMQMVQDVSPLKKIICICCLDIWVVFLHDATCAHIAVAIPSYVVWPETASVYNIDSVVALMIDLKILHFAENFGSS